MKRSGLSSDRFFIALSRVSAGFPPLCDLVIAVRSEKAPQSVTLEPGGRKADYTYDGKYLHVKLDRLPIHEIIRVL